MKKQFRVTKLEPIWKCTNCHNERLDEDWDHLPPRSHKEKVDEDWVQLPPIGKHEDRVCTRCKTVRTQTDHVVVAYLIEAEEGS